MLPTREELKEYLRVETPAEDFLLDRLLGQAVAVAEGYIRQPISARPVTVTIHPRAARAVGYTSGARLVFPLAPIAAGSVSITADDGTTVAPTDYTVNAARGEITFATTYGYGYGSAWSGADVLPCTVTATAGLSLRPDYDQIEPALSAAILYIASDLYQRRNPAAEYESAGGGVAVTYNESANTGLTGSVMALLAPFRRVLV